MPRLISTLVLCWLVIVPAIARGQAHPAELDELRARLDRLERENHELRVSIQPHSPLVVDAGADPRAMAALPHAQPVWSDVPMPSAVEQHLQGHSAQFAATGAPLADMPAGESAAGSIVGQDLSMTARWNNGLEVS